MTPALGEVDYREPGQALVCGASFEPDDEAVQCVAVIDEKDEDVSREAEWIAEEIERLVAAGKYDYGDMVVLMRFHRAADCACMKKPLSATISHILQITRW